MKGTIKRLVTEKKFGFIAPEGADKDVFFHESELVGVTFAELNEGDAVTFETVASEKGPKAVQVARA